jgi:acylglycerol lipase
MIVWPENVEVPTSDGLKLHAAWWPAAIGSRAVVVIGHGLGEHSGLYDHVCLGLNRALDIGVLLGFSQDLIDADICPDPERLTLGLSVLAFDFRGHGRSPGQRGYVRNCDRFIDDWQSAISFANSMMPGRRVFALGHSYGGLSALMAASADRLDCAGLIISNPALRVRMAVPPLKVAFGRFLRVVAPRVTLSAELPIEDLTRDPEMQKRRQTDTLAHNRISAPLYFGMREGAEAVLKAPDRVRLPLLMLLGLADPIIDARASEQWFERCASSDKTMKTYPEIVHEPLSDLGRDVVIEDITKWLAKRVD